MNIDDEITNESVKKAILHYGKLFLVFMLLLIAVFNVPAWVGPGQRGVLMEWGKVREDVVLNPGLHLIIPFYNSVVMTDVQTKLFNGQLSAASSDLQNAKTLVGLNYHVSYNGVPIVYRDIGIDYETKVIIPTLQDTGKTATAKFTAEELIKNREDVRALFQKLLAERLLVYGIIVEQISLTDFEFSPTFTKTIEDKVTAQQLFQKAEFDLQRITIEAKQKVAQAEGEKQATILIAEGRAREVEIIQKQLTQSPQYINYMAVRSWNGVLPMVTGSGGIPLIQIPTNAVTTK